MSLQNVSQFYIDFNATPMPSSPDKKSSFLPRAFKGRAMLDSGATSCFIHSSIIKVFRLPTFPNLVPKKLKVIDGREVSSGLVTKHCKIKLEIGGHMENLECHVVDIGSHDIVLGMSWLKRHNPNINWEKKTLHFTSQYFIKQCLETTNHIQIHALEGLPSEYTEFEDVFSGEKQTKLPPHRNYHCGIEFTPGAKMRHQSLFHLTEAQKKECWETLQRMIELGQIRPSKSQMASSILFVKKKDGKLRMCIDYRYVNSITKT